MPDRGGAPSSEGRPGRRGGFPERSAFQEYAALARHLHELHRSGERTAEQVNQRRDATEAAITQLEHRFVLQRQRLAELARSIGEPVPGGSEPFPPPGQPPSAGQFPPPPPPPGAGLSPPRPGAALPSGAAHPELPPGPTRLALPATSAPGPAPGPGADPSVGAAQWAVPPPRSTSEGQPLHPAGSGAGHPAGPAADPDRELELARQALEVSESAASRVEQLAERPALLPGWSSMARAMTIYVGFAVTVAGFHCGGAVFGIFDVFSFTYIAWSYFGLPAVAFFMAYLLLQLFGKPRIGQPPSSHPRLGFLICFLIGWVGPCIALAARIWAGPAG